MFNNTPHSNASNLFEPPTVLTPHAFHDAIGGAIGKNRIYELLRAGRIRHVRNGSRYLIPSSEVQAYFEREAAQTTPASGWSL